MSQLSSRGSFRLSFIALAAGLVFVGCAHNPNKAEKIDTKVENEAMVSGDTRVGVKEGNMVVQRKVMMNEELRRIQNEVYELEDHVYGNRKYGSLGLYGVLKDCRTQTSNRDNGGSGKLAWTEPLDRVTDKDEDMNVGLDDHQNLIGVNEEMLKTRIERFRGYKSILQKREDEYEDKVAICKNELRNRKSDKSDKAEKSEKAE